MTKTTTPIITVQSCKILSEYFKPLCNVSASDKLFKNSWIYYSHSPWIVFHVSLVPESTRLHLNTKGTYRAERKWKMESKLEVNQLP